MVDQAVSLGPVRPSVVITLISVLVAIVALLALWFDHLRSAVPAAPVNVSVPATAAPEIRAIPTKPVAIKAPLRVYTGGTQLKTRLKLPKPVIDDTARQVIAASQVRADDHPQAVTTVINTDTGASETFVKRDPLPWLAWDTRGEVGMYMGLKNGGAAVRIEARQGLVQIKALHVGVTASLDQSLSGAAGGMDSFVGVGVWTRW